MMRSITIGLAALLLLALPSTNVLARGGHGGGGHWGGGGAHWSGGGGHWSGGGARWSGGHWGGGSHWRGAGWGHFARFHHRRFFVGYAAYDLGCWRARPTPWGWQRVWVCGNPYYGWF